MGEIVKMENSTALSAMTETELIGVLQASLYPGAALPSIKMVIGYCKAAGLDPMQKPVHIVPMFDRASGHMRDVIMPGVGLYRTQAARSGQLAGISEPEFGPSKTETIGGQPIEYPDWCRVVVKRQMPSGAIAEFAAIEYWIENYALKGGKEKSIAPNAMWLKRPRGQIAKCAQAQALRMAFPEMTGSAPTADEMEGKQFESEIDITPKPEPVAKRPEFCTDAKFAENRDAWRKLVESGKKTTEGMIATIGSRAPLTEAQKAEINGWKVKKQEPEVNDAAPVVTQSMDDFNAGMAGEHIPE